MDLAVHERPSGARAQVAGKLLKYYHGSRTHLGLCKDTPEPRAAMKRGTIFAIPQVGGLHHRYERRAA